MTEPKRIFADEKTKAGWEVAEKVSRLSAKLPPEPPALEPRPIRFKPEDESIGMTAVLIAGSVGFAGGGIVLVPQRTIRILDKLHIPYQAATLE